MKVKPVSHSVSLIDRNPRTNTKHRVIFYISVISFLASLLYPLLLETPKFENDTSTLSWILWKVPICSTVIYDLAAVMWSNSFEYDDLFSNHKHLSHDSSTFVKTRTSQDLESEDRQHWMV